MITNSVIPGLFYIVQPQQHSCYESYVYDNKTIRNTLEHAEQDGNNSEEYLKRARRYNEEGNELQLQRACRSATKEAVDSTEKFLKVAINTKSMQNSTFKNERGRNERVINTHSIEKINEIVDESWLTNEEVRFMDSFKDEENRCYSSHTGLSYGDVNPTLDEAEKAVEIKRKVENNVKEFRNRVFAQQTLVRMNV